MATAYFAVIGNPIAHSKSPLIHQAFGTQVSMSLVYSRLLCEPDDFEYTVDQFFKAGGKGLNVTVPFKEKAFVMSQCLTPRATAAQAVNTLYLNNQGQLVGDNTDGVGLVADLLKHIESLNNKTVLIYGAGGATRGVILPLAQAGVTQVAIVNRTHAKAVQLQQDFSPLLTPLNCHIQALSTEEVSGFFDVVINATSASLHSGSMHLPDHVNCHLAYEMAYGVPSDFIQYWQHRGVPSVDGRGMLIEQAAEAFYVWNNHKINTGMIDLNDIFASKA